MKAILFDTITHATGSRVRALIDESRRVYDQQNHFASPKGIYVRNPRCLISGLDFACVSPWNSSSTGQEGAGTLITPRHALFAKHNFIGTNQSLRFVTSDNRVIERNVVGQHDFVTHDLTIGFLDRAITEINPAKFVPADFHAYVDEGDPSNFKGMPAIIFDQDENIAIGEINGEPENGFSIDFRSQSELDIHHQSFFDYVIQGDSGNPVFVLIGQQPALLTLLRFANQGRGQGVSLRKLRDDLNDAITDDDATLEIQEVSLDDFVPLGINAGDVESEIEWGRHKGVNITGSSVRKIADTQWGNAGAASVQKLRGNGSLEFRASDTNHYFMCGLSETDRDFNFKTIDYAIQCRPHGKVWIYESFGHWNWRKVSNADIGYGPGTRLAIRRTGNTVSYLKDGVAFLNSTKPTSKPLVADSAFFDTGSELAEAKLIMTNGFTA